MKRNVRDRRRTFALLVIAAALIPTTLAAAQADKSSTSSELPPGSAGLIQPDDLLNAIRASGTAKPVVLYVGPPFLYKQARIPGAEFIGPASDPQALDKLRKRTATLPRDALIVLYCGCCPWDHCPNIRPALKELQKLGFSKVKALYLANSFGTDWVDKGYPAEKGN